MIPERAGMLIAFRDAPDVLAHVATGNSASTTKPIHARSGRRGAKRNALGRIANNTIANPTGIQAGGPFASAPNPTHKPASSVRRTIAPASPSSSIKSATAARQKNASVGSSCKRPPISNTIATPR